MIALNPDLQAALAADRSRSLLAAADRRRLVVHARRSRHAQTAAPPWWRRPLGALHLRAPKLGAPGVGR